MSLFAFISLLSSMICFYVGIIVYSQSKKELVHKLFFLLCLVNANWGFVEFMVRQTENPQTALFWVRVGSTCLLTLPIAVHFILVYTGRSRLVQKWWALTILYVPVLFFIVIFITTDLILDSVVERYWGYSYTLSPSSLFRNFFLLWTISMGISVVIISFVYYRRMEDPTEKRRAYFVALGCFLPVFFANLSQVISPIFDLQIPEMTSFAGALQEIAIGYAIWKYDLFSLNPVTAAENIIATMPDMLFLLSPEGKIVSINRAVSKVLGYREEQLIRNPLLKIMPVELSDHILKGLLSSPENRIDSDPAGKIQSKPIEGHLKTKEGHEIPVSLAVSVLVEKDVNLAGYVVIARDITEQKKTEDALRKSEDKYRSLFENIADAVYIIDLETYKFLDCNHAALFRYGYTKEELLSMTLHQLHSPVDHEIVSKDLAKGEKIGLRVYTHFSSSGEKIPVEVYSKEIIYNDRRALLSITRDITPRKKAEKRRKDLEAQLQRAQKMEALGTLAGGVAHDLNNILSGIVSYPDLILLDLPKDSPLKQPILTIKSSGEKAAAIVQDLLTLARRGVVIKEVVNLNHVIEEYLQSPEHKNLLYYHSNVNIKKELAEDLLFISGSPIHLSKIIMNLCSNALEAIPGNGEIRIFTKNQYLDMPIRGYTHIEEGDYVTVTVSDNGTGINRKDIDRIFEPFYSRKVLGKSGTGLGMAVVWGTMNDHHGYISVESKEGKGTTFTLYFPVTREESQDDESRLQIQDLMGNGESILIVDDIKEQRDIVSFMLKRLGYSVHVASSGEEAVDFVRENPMDLLVLDMIMDPGIDGAETYKRIIEIYPNQKAIITSGFTETERVKEAQQMGAGVYIKKPYQMDKIGLAIKQELNT